LKLPELEEKRRREYGLWILLFIVIIP
jgi:hypothetical protein